MNGSLSAYYVEENGVVTKAEQYEFQSYWNGNMPQDNPRSVTKTAAPSSLYKVGLDSYSFVAGDTATTGRQTKYRDKSLGWTNRRVSSYKGIEFSYDGQGRRIAKGNISYIYDSQNRLLKQSNGLEFFYDQSGVSSVKYAGKTYFYRKDILGNIIALIDTNGSVVVKYSYNAWGYNGVSDINGNVITDENHIGNLNPFRYRGYYYDTETKLYYLKTRYYDPETGRFISQDYIEYIAPNIINGLNLYAYCVNNPIGLCDPSGCSALAALIIGLLLLFTPVGGTVWQITASVLGYAGIAIASLFDKDIKNDMDSIGWNPFNADESLVTGSTKVSFYKGAPVFRTNASRSWSFGAIFFVKGRTADELRHERGHNWQLMMMGLATYGFTVAIPSSLELGGWSAANKYYKAPWEALASILGGDTSSGLTKEEISTAWLYFGLSHLLIPPIFFWFK